MENSFLCLKQSKRMGRGLYARKDIPSGTVLLTIPEHRFITFSNLSDQPLFFELEHEIETSKMVVFAYFLVYCHRAPQLLHSEMAQITEYLSKLPTTPNNLISWEDAELQMIHNQQLVKKVQERRSNYLQDFQKLKITITFKQQLTQLQQAQQQSTQPLRGGRKRRTFRKAEQTSQKKQELGILQKIQFSQILRMIAVIESRNIYYQTFRDSKSEVGALIPFLDFFNHSSNAQCQVELNSVNEKVYSTRPISKGEQVFVNYGKNISLEQFLEFYGMIPEEYSPLTQKENIAISYKGEQSLSGSCAEQGEAISSERRELASLYNRFYDLRQPHQIRQGKDPLSAIQASEI